MRRSCRVTAEKAGTAPPGDPLESRRALETFSGSAALISRKGRDLYGRTLARVQVEVVDLSCAQLAGGHAIYRSDWDQFGLVGTDCGITRPPQAVRASPSTPRGHKSRSAPRAAGTGWSYCNCADARRAGAAPLRRGAGLWDSYGWRWWWHRLRANQEIASTTTNAGRRAASRGLCKLPKHCRLARRQGPCEWCSSCARLERRACASQREAGEPCQAKHRM